MTAVPAPRTWVAGEIVTAAEFNSTIRDVDLFQLSPPILKIRQTIAQSIPNNANTPLNYDTEEVDSSGMHSTVTNTSRATAVYPGWYWGAGCYTAAASAAGIRTLQWAINGAVQNGMGSDYTTIGAGASNRLGAIGGMWFLNVGDYLELSAFQNSGGALNTAVSTVEQSTMSLHWESN